MAKKRDATPSGKTDQVSITVPWRVESALPSPEKMSDDALGKFVSHHLTQLAAFAETLKPYYLELRERFAKKKSKSETISGCHTWAEYCDKTLDRTKRAVNYFLAGGNPVSKRSAQLPGGKSFPTQQVYVNVIEEKKPPISVAVNVEPSPISETRVFAAAPEEPAPEPSLAKIAAGIFDPKLESSKPVKRRSRMFIGADEAYALQMTTEFLTVFEQNNFGAIEPEEIGERLTEGQIEIMTTCKEWMDKILRAA